MEANCPRTNRSWFGAAPLKVYVSFGTVSWRYYAPEACRGLTALADAFAETDLQAVISLGSTGSRHVAAADLTRPNVRVEDHVDQWEVLAEADVFLTHHGMNSTHEAISQRVPMISYPFFWDQPGLAAKCGGFGLAVPLTDSPRGAFGREAVRAAFNRLAEERDRMGAALSRARGWEETTIGNRPAVLQRIAELIV